MAGGRRIEIEAPSRLLAQVIEETKAILARLLSFKPISFASNLDLVGFCADWLMRHGAACTMLPSPDGQKAGLLATIGPHLEGGVVLSGHTDVVSVEGQSWATDPWRLHEVDGRLHGRGTTDMLGFVALALAIVPVLPAAGLRRPIHLALSYDEEVGCEGGRRLVDHMSLQVPTPSAVIVGEPTGNDVACGHKSYLELKTVVRGRAVHSSRPDLGASALVGAARLVAWLDDVHRSNARRSEPMDLRFDPPFTTHCGMFHAGTAASTVADRAWFTTDIRSLPNEDPAVYVEHYRVQATRLLHTTGDAARCCFDIDVVADIPALRPELTGVAQTLMRSAGAPNSGRMFPGGTEAGLYQQAGWSTVVCGPGDLTRAHATDEFVLVSELAATASILLRIAARLSADN